VSQQPEHPTDRPANSNGDKLLRCASGNGDGGSSRTIQANFADRFIRSFGDRSDLFEKLVNIAAATHSRAQRIDMRWRV